MSKRKWNRKKQRVDITQCEKCLYRPTLSDSNFHVGCAYIFLMGHRRPSEPSPNCTVFKKFNKKDRQKIEQEIKEKFVSGKGM